MTPPQRRTTGQSTEPSGNEQTAELQPRHGRHPADPGTFIKHVGWAFRCLCGADRVAGYPCHVEQREAAQHAGNGVAP